MVVGDTGFAVVGGGEGKSRQELGEIPNTKRLSLNKVKVQQRVGHVSATRLFHVSI